MMKAETNIDNVSLADMVSTLKKKVQEVEHRLGVAENLLFESINTSNTNNKGNLQNGMKGAW